VKAFILIVAVLIAIDPATARDGVARPARWYRPEYVAPRRPAPPPPPAIAIPQQFSPPQETYASFPAPATAGSAAPASTEPSPCQLRLGKLATFKPLPLLVGPGECGAADAVRLESVTLPDDAKVALSPPATLRCTMAEQMALWLRENGRMASDERSQQSPAMSLSTPVISDRKIQSLECGYWEAASRAVSARLKLTTPFVT